MSVEDELNEAMGEAASASAGMRLRHAIPLGGDSESRRVALELNLERIYLGLVFLARQIDDLRTERGGR